MKDTKRVFASYSFYDHTGMEKSFEKMAAKGWLVEKPAYLGWRYRRIEPKSLTFTVTYFPGASDFDPVPGDGQQTFWELCELAGWKLACTTGQLQVFYNENPDAVPIETDAILQLENIHASAKRAYLWQYIFYIILGLLYTWMLIGKILYDPAELFSNNIQLFNMVCFPTLIIISIAELITYYRWRKKAIKAAETTNEFLPTKGTGNLQGVMLLLIIVLLIFFLTNNIFYGEKLYGIFITAYLLGIAALGFLLNRIKNMLKSHGVSAKRNLFFTLAVDVVLAIAFVSILTYAVIAFVEHSPFETHKPVRTYVEESGWEWDIYADAIPLKVEDLTAVRYKDYSYIEDKVQSSVFLSKKKYRQWAIPNGEDAPEISYTILDTHFSPIYHLCLESLLRLGEEDVKHFGESWEPIDAIPWNADAVWQKYYGSNPSGQYIICYDNRIIELDCFNLELTTAGKKAIGEKLSAKAYIP